MESSASRLSPTAWFWRALLAAGLSGAVPVLGVFFLAPVTDFWWILGLPCLLFIGLPFVGAYARQISLVTIAPNAILGLWFLLLGFPFGFFTLIGLSLWAAGAMRLMVDSFELFRERPGRGLTA